MSETHLSMITSARTRHSYRVHWSTWIVLLLVGSALVQCHIRGDIYRSHEGGYYGWPFVHPGNPDLYLSNAFFLNLVAGTLMLLSTGFVFERCFRTTRRLRFRLSTALLSVAILAVLLGLLRWQEGLPDSFALPVDFVGGRVLLDPTTTEHRPWYVWIPILLGLGFTMYSTCWLAGFTLFWLFRVGKTLVGRPKPRVEGAVHEVAATDAAGGETK